MSDDNPFDESAEVCNAAWRIASEIHDLAVMNDPYHYMDVCDNPFDLERSVAHDLLNGNTGIWMEPLRKLALDDENEMDIRSMALSLIEKIQCLKTRTQIYQNEERPMKIGV